jgi:hypothetical protein
MIHILTIVLAISIFTGRHCLAGELDTPLTVCEVLSKLDKYRGKEVGIRGVLMGGRHGSALYDRNQAEAPCPEVLKQQRTWPSAVYLVWPNQKTVDGGPRRFEPELEAIEKNMADARKQVRENRDQLIVATFFGEVRARRRIAIFPREDWYLGNGYGQGGQYPAQLVIRTVTDTEVIDSRDWKPRTQSPTKK